MLIQPKMKGASCVRMKRLVPFGAFSYLVEMQSKYALSSTCMSRPLDGRIRDDIYVIRVLGYPGTQWTRFRSPEMPGYPVASQSPTSRIWRVPVRGGYPAGGTPTAQAVRGGGRLYRGMKIPNSTRYYSYPGIVEELEPCHTTWRSFTFSLTNPLSCQYYTASCCRPLPTLRTSACTHHKYM